MYPGNKLILLVCSLLSFGTARATSHKSVSDSLKLVLAHTSAPEERVNLLLDIKNLNEDTNLNLPYSIQLFREAAAIGDTYAMGISVIPIINRYSAYAEKEDSLFYYVRTLRKLTPGTPQEGMDAYAELYIAYRRIFSAYDKASRLQIAKDILEWCNKPDSLENPPYSTAKRLIGSGIAKMYIAQSQGETRHYYSQIALWKQAYEVIRQMPNIETRRSFFNLLYTYLSFAYLQAKNYPELLALSREYIDLTDTYFNLPEVTSRNRYLFQENSYVMPFLRMIRCAVEIDRPDSAKKHFEEYRMRMLNVSAENRSRSLTYVYETGYKWKYFERDYAAGFQYCDSLVTLINQGRGYYKMRPDKISQIYLDRSMMLAKLARYPEAYDSYEKTYKVLDSLDLVERKERIQTLLDRNEMDKIRLSETRASIRNHITAIVSMLILAILLIVMGLYFYRAMRRNRILQADIMRHGHKALESERMKSNFVNSLCGRVRPPFNAIDRAAHRLMIMEMPEQERMEYLETIRENTTQLLSTLDNMLEAANLDSLTDKLHLIPTDIGALCREEMTRMSLRRPNKQIEYKVEQTEQTAIVPTHTRYFRFVIGALLDNAGRFTRAGSITLSYEIVPAENKLRVWVIDTGCGITEEQRRSIFSTDSQGPAAAHGLSLALCNLIAIRMKGGIRLENTSPQGTTFLFTIPVHP